MSSYARTVGVIAVLCASVVACGPPRSRRERPAGPPPSYPGTLRAPETLRSPAGLGDAFALEQWVRAEYPEGMQEFRAVLQLSSEGLVLVGFGPHGGRGFVLQQHGLDVELESHLPEELSFPPEFMLHDVQRVWFRGLEGPLPDGEHRDTIDGEEVVERWDDGRLMQRTFRRLDGNPPGILRARYLGGLGPHGPPERVDWDNGWFGYRLILTTLSHHRLEEPAGSDESDVPM